MKISKLLIFSSVLVVFFFACKDDDQEPPRITGYDYLMDKCLGNNYELNEDQTACVCPEGTHYKLEPVPDSNIEVTKCREILEGSFLYKADVKSCLYETRSAPETLPWFENVYEGIGMAEFDFENGSLYLWLGSSGDGERLSFSIFGGGVIGVDQPGMTFHEDGSFSVLYYGLGNWEEDCLDWEERSEGCSAYHVTTRGRSNADRTRINLEMVWENCRREELDRGTIEMWKEW